MVVENCLFAIPLQYESVHIMLNKQLYVCLYVLQRKEKFALC